MINSSSLAPTVVSPTKAETLTATLIDSSPPDAGAINGYLPNLPPDLQIQGVLGKGGMGWVLRARQKSLDRDVAVKVISPKYSTSSRFTSMMMQEARILAKMQHPNIVQIYQVGTTNCGSIYIVMELIEGESLREQDKERALMAKEGSPQKQRRRLSTIFSIMFQLCDALDAAHLAGIVHRDVKPANIQIDREGRVRLMDFGLALLAEADGENPAPAGTLSYMAPEQALAPGEVDHRADVFALGGVLFFLLTGRPPRKAKSFSGITKGIVNNLERTARDSFIPLGIPKRLIAIMEKALKLKPQNRYPSVKDFRLALEGVYLTEVRPAASITKFIKRHFIFVLVGTILLTSVCVSLIPMGPSHQDVNSALALGSGPLRIGEAQREIDLRLGLEGVSVEERNLLISWKNEIEQFADSGDLTRAIETADYAKHFIERAQLEELAQVISEMSEGAVPRTPGLRERIKFFLNDVEQFRLSGTDYKDLPILRARGMRLLSEL